ncbi:hypothetical protein ROZALSC1DRAFT_29153 [Rozella allomycis CSF55]|uniref:Uncharacterized protein n=1 Tax=Rozella allomycis (strain CSF55) TaxID=988480 RepID=A0A4P9YIL3_ROZAC|nr:hypothetical protein ROZALSC1DRAFT_29153 [Rozella allomycis CSF55]
MVFLKGLYVLVFLIVGLFASDENRYSSESEGFSLGGMIRSSLEMESLANDIVEAESNFPNEFNAMLMMPGTVLTFFNYRDNTRNFQYIKLSSVIHCLPDQIIYQGRIENEEANSINITLYLIPLHLQRDSNICIRAYQKRMERAINCLGHFMYQEYDMNEEDLHDSYLCLANVFLSTVQHYTSLGSRVQAENMRLQFLKPKIHVSTLSPLSPNRNSMRMKFKNEQLYEAWKYLQTQSTLIFGKSHVESHYSTFVTEFLRMSLLENSRSDLEEFNLYNIFNIDYDNILRHISVLDIEQEKNIFENLQNSILSLNKINKTLFII